jgi:hypothetical protein
VAAQQVVNRLAHLVPCSTDYGVDNASDLVLNALLFSPSALTAAGVVQVIAERLGCAMPRDQAAEKLNDLNQRGLVLLVRGGYILTGQVKEALLAKQLAFRDRYQEIVDNWLRSIGPNYVDVQLNDLKVISDDLWEYLNSLFLTHGVESLSFVTDTGTEPPIAVDAIQVPAELRSDNESIVSLEKSEFPRFLGSGDPDIIRLLFDLIDRAVRYLTTVVDPDVLTSLKEKLFGKVLYLDSNAIYRLVNLQGPHRYQVMTSVIELCREAGFELRVNRVTLDELRRRLNFDAGVLRRHPVPTNLAAVGVRYLTDENYVSTYWRLAASERISAEDFITHYNHIDSLLLDLGIQVETEVRTCGRSHCLNHSRSL